MPQQFDVDGARQAGATDDQILSYLAQRAPGFDVQGALRQTSKQDVIGYLSTHSAPPGGAPQRPDFAQNPPGMPTPSYARGASSIERQELQNPRSPNFAGDMPGVSEGAGLAGGLAEWTRAGFGGMGPVGMAAKSVIAGCGTVIRSSEDTPARYELNPACLPSTRLKARLIPGLRKSARATAGNHWRFSRASVRARGYSGR